MNLLLVVSMLAVAVVGTGVVLTRDPLRQAAAAGAFGLVMAVLFVLLRAPDAAISEIAVGSVFIPGLVLFAVAKTRGEDG